MKVITIESSAYKAVTEQIAEIAGFVREVRNARREKNTDRPVGTEEAARMLGVCKRTLQRYRSVGALPYKTLGKKTYYSETDVLTFLTGHVRDFKKEDVEFYKARIHNFFNK